MRQLSTRLMLALSAVLFLPLLVFGAPIPQEGPPVPKSSSKTKLNKGMSSLGGGSGLFSTPYKYEASYDVEEGGERGRVAVRLSLSDGYHTYSITQGAGGPAPTVISIKDSAVSLAGPFTPDASPEVSTDELGFEGVRVEKHHGDVVWIAPVYFKPALSGTPSPIKIKVDSQVCLDSCIPVKGLELEATFKSFYASAKTSNQSGPFREKDSLVEWSVSLSKSVVASGDKFDLILSAVPDSGVHIYKNDPTDKEIQSRTLIALTQKAGLIAGKPVSDVSFQHKKLGSEVEVDYYPDKVTFRVPLQVPKQAIEGVYPIQGLIGYQGCTDKSCDQPRGIKFTSEFIVAAKSNNEPAAAQLSAVPFKEVAENPNLFKWIDSDSVALTLSPFEILSKFCLAMLGGLILNFMPCVLPVIGLKILGFVTEANGDRKTASALTLTYSAGIISLILGLGILSVAVRYATGTAYGWGEQFGSTGFRIVITAFMFSLALSFLGVWEIPIPGFAMGKTSTELSNREGYVGAFCKGLITTLLATPCSAPFLGSVFVVALTQPAWVVLLIFLGVGVGMALPYLVIAAEPSLMKLLPKPGPWMETFKEVLAFPLLLSVVFFVSGFLDKDRMAMLSSLMFVWFACWLLGRVPAWAETRAKVRSWIAASAVAVAGTIGSFYFLQPSQYELAWREYEESELDKLVADGKTVMIDFTANWCQNCKLNLRVALETKRVKEYLEEEGIVPMVADMTNYPVHVRNKLNELNSVSIPVLAIYSGSDTENPMVLRDVLTESQVLDALKEAQSKGKQTGMATSAKSNPSSNVQ